MEIDEIFPKVARIIADTSEVPYEDIRLDSEIDAHLGIDSLDFLDCTFAFRREFLVYVDADIFENPNLTVRHICEGIESALQKST